MATGNHFINNTTLTHNTLAAAGFDGSCLPIFAAVVGMTFCVDLGGVAGGGVGTGAD